MRYLCLLLTVCILACKSKTENPTLPVFDDALFAKVRNAVMTVPGNLPAQISYIKYASTLRTWKDLVDGGSDDPAVMARTAFKIEYADGFIMIDAGMDKQVQHFFEKDSGPQPFDDAAAAKVASAVQKAKLILITHEHGDHVANVIRMSDNSIPPKTVLTKEQADALVHDPQMPEIKLNEEKSKAFLLVDFESVFPVAPGVVLIKSPGHTKGEIMIYTKLQNGREFIFAGDVSWTYKGVAENRQKPATERKRVGEDKENIATELSWLNQRLLKDKVTVLVSHDDIMLPQLAAQGIIKNDF